MIFLAERLQEAADALPASNIRDRLADAVRDACKAAGTYGCYYVDHVGDENAGTVYFTSYGDDLQGAPYTMAPNAGAAHSVAIDMAKAFDAVCTTTYLPEPADADDALEAGKKVPAVAAESATEKPAPVEAALVESSCAFVTPIAEAAGATNPLAKIISAGRGSSGFYSAEVLKRDGPKLIKRGTLMYVNHATAAEEASRPEGDYNNLAAVTTGDAYWDEAGKDGPALYAPTKVFSDYSTAVAEKAPFTGLSIRARGMRDDKSLAPDGKPGIITELTHVESVDLVTKAGRDGKFLLESATANSDLTEGASAMDAEELKKLQETNTRILRGFAETKARVSAATKLTPIRLPEAAKTSILERAIGKVPLTAAGELDETAFGAVLEAEITYAASFIPGGAQVVGLGAVAQPDPKVSEAQRVKDAADRDFELNRSAASMGIKTEAGRRIFREGRRAFDPQFNSADKVEVGVGG